MFIETPLKPNFGVIVKLTALKHKKPVKIVLTNEDALSVHSYESLAQLCDNTYSLEIETGTPENGDEIAVGISPDGVVCISHNNGNWTRKIVVDNSLEYHVVFDMEHVSFLSTMGITTGVKPNAPLFPFSRSELPRCDNQPECVVCTQYKVNVLVHPCSHLALCELCASRLRETEQPKCPMCREGITDLQKVYLP